MQIVIDVVLVLLCATFIGLVLKTLGESQKLKEIIHPPGDFLLTLQLKPAGNEQMQTLEFLHKDVAVLQNVVNSFALFRIRRCKVTRDEKVTHVMNPKGILEAV